MSFWIILGIIYLIYTYFFSSDGSKLSDGGSRGNTYSQVPDLEHSLLWIIATVMMADGVATKNELAAVKQFLLRSMGEKSAKKMLLLLRDILKMDQKTDIRLYCISINQQLSYQDRVAVLSLLFQIAIADGNICDEEARMIQLYARFTRIRELDFYHMKNYYTYNYEWQDAQDNRGKYRQQKNQSNNTSSSYDHNIQWALKTLGLKEGASEKEIKKAYRALALQYHPDKQIGASDEEVKRATERFREINEAYELLTAK